ncbi:MAG: type II toxin-antitoxin system HicB family antitoxin [Candidatus Vogelbacteria bacterium]|nr:type II toxin-antitoxin system HicB family antitoxin [Candidatus Vogelbacteria bacterium]
MTTTYTFRTIIEQDEDGTYRAFVPLLPGCHTWGWETIEMARAKLHEALDLYIKSLIEEGEDIPLDRSIESIETVTLPAYA